MTFIGQFVLAFMAFLAIMNPLANLPVFLGLTSGSTAADRARIARRAMILTFALIAVFALGGKWIFEAFGITLPALRITGGALVFLIGFHMVQGKSSQVTHEPAHAALQQGTTPPVPATPARKTAGSAPVDDTRSAGDAAAVEQRLGVAISPLAMPILAGPGTIATAMNLAAQKSWEGIVAALAAFAVLCVLTWIVFRYGAGITKVMGRSAMTVMTRLMGLILAVIGVQMLIAGLTAAFPVLTHGG